MLVGVCFGDEVAAVQCEADLPEIGVDGEDEEHSISKHHSGLNGQLLDGDLAGNGVFHVCSSFLELPGHFDQVRLHDFLHLDAVELEEDGDFDEAVEVQGGAAIGGAVVGFDLLELAALGADLAPEGLVGDRGSCA